MPGKFASDEDETLLSIDIGPGGYFTPAEVAWAKYESEIASFYGDEDAFDPANLV